MLDDATSTEAVARKPPGKETEGNSGLDLPRKLRAICGRRIWALPWKALAVAADIIEVRPHFAAIARGA